MKTTMLILATAIVAAGALWGLGYAENALFLKKTAKKGEWQRYTSDAFHFQITIPPDWTVIEFPNDEIAPRVNIYNEWLRETRITKKNGIRHVSPIDHHSDIPNVSIFPHGVPTEGFFGTFIESDVSFTEQARVAHDFVLKDGARFATFVSFENAPESWNEFGFIWARAPVHKMRAECYRGEILIKDEAACDPFTGDVIAHSGGMRAEDREIQKQILASFTFVR